MKVMNMVNAINNALDLKLQEDENIIVYGQDVGVEGGVFRVTEGLQKKYSEKRVFDSPLAESAIVGTSIGMAIAGLRPVVEIQFSGFVLPAFNQIIAHAARMRNRTRGRYNTPIVIRMPYGGGINALEHHSESLEAIFGHIPGIKIVIPSSPHDAKGLLISAIESNDTVIFMEPKKLYRAIKQEVPEEKYSIPIGKANILSEGKDITIITYGSLVRDAQEAVIMAEKKGISVELIDLRSIYPIDKDTIRESVTKTGRVITITESPRSFGVGSEISQIVIEEAFLSLEAPPKRLAGFDTIVPYPQGEHFYIQTAQKIFYEIQKTMNF